MPGPEPRLIIMAKAPRPGHCKTRLCGRLGLRGAARMQAHLTRNRISAALSSGFPVHIYAEPDVRHPIFLAARRLGAKIHRQHGLDLGLRMRNALGRAPGVIIGTDCPALTGNLMRNALEQVRAGKPQLIPAHDGGYVLIGLNHACPRLFRSITWSSAKVLAQTLRQQRLCGVHLNLSTPLHDLDTTADYQRERRAARLPALH